jgi:hypothetical protein
MHIQIRAMAPRTPPIVSGRQEPVVRLMIWGCSKIEDVGTRDGEGSLHAGGGDWWRCWQGTAAAARCCNPNPSEKWIRDGEDGEKVSGCLSGWKIARRAWDIRNGMVWVICPKSRGHYRPMPLEKH